MNTLDFLGAHGGQLALAFGSGCVAGYGFCMRTIYKLLEAQKDRDHQQCMERIKKLEEEKISLHERLCVVEDRLYMGSERQMAQLRQSSITLLERKDDNESR